MQIDYIISQNKSSILLIENVWRLKFFHERAGKTRIKRDHLEAECVHKYFIRETECDHNTIRYHPNPDSQMAGAWTDGKLFGPANVWERAFWIAGKERVIKLEMAARGAHR